MNNGNLAYRYEVPVRKNNTNARLRRNTAAGAVKRGKTSRAGGRYGAAVINGRIIEQNKIDIRDSRAQMLHRKKTLSRIVYILITAVAASFMITKFVAVNETSSQINKLQSQLEGMRATTSQKIFEMEQSVDLSSLEQEAKTRLGMQRPEKYQVIYVDVKQDDVTGVTAGEVEGFKNNIGNFFEKLKKNIVEAFSIK